MACRRGKGDSEFALRAHAPSVASSVLLKVDSLGIVARGKHVALSFMAQSGGNWRNSDNRLRDDRVGREFICSPVLDTNGFELSFVLQVSVVATAVSFRP
jgi:hypothetical protein